MHAETMQSASGRRTDAAAAKPLNVESLAARARELVPAIAARAEQASSQCDLHPETIAELKEAGLFRLFVPGQWGGYEADPRVFYEIQNILAGACASTAWVYGVLSVQALVMSLFDARAQEDVWGDGRQALSCSSYQPAGAVARVKGGFEISGRWTFSSGSSFAKWATLGGIVPGQGDTPPEMRLFLVPKTDYEIVDVWRTFGLRATGSNDIVVKGAFVPVHRSFKPDMTPSGLLPRRADAGETPGTYHLPWLYVFGSAVSNLGIGIARGALAGFRETVQRRPASKARGGLADGLRAIGAARAQVEIASVEAMYDRHVSRMLAAARDRPMTVQDALAMRTELCGALRRMAATVDDLNQLLGGNGVRLDSPLTRAWLDIMAARAHPGNDPTAIAAQLGEIMLGS